MKYDKLPSASDPPADYLISNPKFWPFFEGCLGAIDVSHIACTLSVEDQANSRNCKGFLSQNVLAICNFNMEFVYILSGWDDSVTDAFLYMDACLTDLAIPQDHFYLADAGFPLCDSLLTPYGGVWYHLAE